MSFFMELQEGRGALAVALPGVGIGFVMWPPPRLWHGRRQTYGLGVGCC